MDMTQVGNTLAGQFGSFNAVGVLHSVVAVVSKYVIIVLFALYTWQCFTVFAGRNQNRKRDVCRRQNILMYTIHFICSLVLFLNSTDINLIFLYLGQVIILVFVNRAYRYVYRSASRVVLNNMLMLLMIGFVMIERLNEGYAVRQMVFAAVIGVLGLFIPFLIEKFRYFDRFGISYAVIGIVLLALVFVFGKSVNGAKNWIVIGGFAFQPSEFVKILYVFFIAAMLTHSTQIKNVAITTALAAAHVLILVAEKDLGGALLFFITYIIILYVASRKVLYLGGGLAVGAVAAVISYRLFSHVQTRVTAWRDPWGTIDNEGYQVAQSLFAIGTGGWFGLGLGEGMPAKIPVAESDFIFAAICEELGVFFAICLILIEISCFILFVNIALKMTKRFYKLTAIGLATEYIFQVFLSIGGVTKFIPSTGVTLPLVSYGGSSLISTIILFCIIEGMYVLNNESGSTGNTKEELLEQEKRGARQRKRAGRNAQRF